MKILLALLVATFLATCFADVYMHNPRGSNDRNCEKDVNRKNANRLFDSQNNAAGGYACPYPDNDKMYYVSGSKLKVEWTSQHGCGNGRTKCDIILQYMCGTEIRDGYPTKDNVEGTARIAENADAVKDLSYGMHENYDYYFNCKSRSRNKGLWIADRNIGGVGATGTRQNNNGDRHGFECPEERDYYPYWHPSPWIDIAFFTDDLSRCRSLVSQSQNVVDKGWCKPNTTTNVPKGNGKWPNNKAECDKVGQWVTEGKFNLNPPECKQHMFSRENHLGNVAQNTQLPEFFNYWWTLPDVAKEQRCTLRIRYNITGTDVQTQMGPGMTFVDWRNNGANSSVIQDPYIQYADNTLAVKINSNQYGRTFQDRSYIFRITPRPSTIPQGVQIYNLNVRGKRGNIVQVYPSTEYDFVPNNLQVQQSDYIHFQWVGSDYNPQRGPNDAEGGPPTQGEDVKQNARADRHNLCEVLAGGRQVPMNDTQLKDNTLFVQSDGTPDWGTIKKLSFLGQSNCFSLNELTSAKDKRASERDPRNCAKINTPRPYFDGGMVKMSKPGTMNYVCTRNNNFSNRDQKGTIVVRASAKRGDIDDETNPKEPVPDMNSTPNSIPRAAGGDPDNTPRSDADQEKFNSVRTPEQMFDVEAFGRGVGTWMADTRQAYVEIRAAALSAGELEQAPAQSDDGLSSGAVAGIAVGCAIGGLIIGAIIGLLVFKSSGGHSMQPLHS